MWHLLSRWRWGAFLTPPAVMFWLCAPGTAGQPAAADPALARQLVHGEDVYFASCALCHNDDLSGGAMHSAPALTGADFQGRWSGRTAADLLEVTRTTMPEGKPRSLDDTSYLDVTAFLLEHNDIKLPAPLNASTAAQTQVH